MPRYYKRKYKFESQKRTPIDRLTIPLINRVANRYIAKREFENRGKFSKTKSKQLRDSDIFKGIRLENVHGFASDNCTNCGSSTQDYCVWTKDYEQVCKKCGAVQPDKYSEDAVDGPQKISSSYQKRTYLSERIRLFGNVEPRIPRQDLKLIGLVYSELDTISGKISNEKSNHKEQKSTIIESSGLPKRCFEEPSTINKAFIKSLLQCVDYMRSKHPSLRNQYGVDKEDKIKFKTKYSERWLQVKVFLCGENYYRRNVCSIPSEDLLNEMYKLSREIVKVFEEKKEEASLVNHKKSVLKTDLIFLVVLFNIEPRLLSVYGWYFSNDSIKRGANSAIRDFENLQKIIHYLNRNLSKQEDVQNLLYKDRWEIPEYSQIVASLTE